MRPHNLKENNFFCLLCSAVIFFTIFYSYFEKFDITVGASNDMKTHWDYIILLNQNINILFQHELGKDFKLLNYPLHHIIISRFDYLVQNPNQYLTIYFVFSLLLPIFFYFCIKKRFPEIKNNKLVFISILIYFLPNFQASSIFANNHITALFFFLASCFFLIKIENSNSQIKFNVFMVTFFMSCAAYTKQYYAVFFLFLLIKFWKITSIKNTLFFILFSILFSIPGIYFLIKNPILLTGIYQKTTNFHSSILISVSIIFFYLIPFFIFNSNRWFFLYLQKVFNQRLLFVFTTFLFLLITFNFQYTENIGGGVFLKITRLTSNNDFLFFLISFFSAIFVICLVENKLENITLMTILALTFSTGFFIFQKYFEPMIIFSIFLLFSKDLSRKYLFHFNEKFIFLYFSLYWVSYFVYTKKYFF